MCSLPGVDDVLGASVPGEFEDAPARYASAKAQNNDAGTSPRTSPRPSEERPETDTTRPLRASGNRLVGIQGRSSDEGIIAWVHRYPLDTDVPLDQLRPWGV